MKGQLQLPPFIPRIERQRPHFEFLWAVRPPAAMVDLTHAKRIAAIDQPSHTEGRGFFPSETDVLLNSCINDSDLLEYSLGQELQIALQLDADYIIPYDLPVYGSMEKETRVENCMEIAAATAELVALLSESTPTDEREAIAAELAVDVDAVNESGLDVLPLIKGREPDEREIMYNTLHSLQKQLDWQPPATVKYGVQHMTVGTNGHYNQLRDEIETLIDERSDASILVIGVGSPTGQYSLEGLPAGVVAGAGLNAWKSRLDVQEALITTTSPTRICEQFESLLENAATATNNLEGRNTPGEDPSRDDDTAKGWAWTQIPEQYGSRPQYREARDRSISPDLSTESKGAIDPSDEEQLSQNR